MAIHHSCARKLRFSAVPALAAAALFLATGTIAVGAADTPLSLAQYISTLEQLRQTVASNNDASAASALAQKLPSEWAVTADGRDFAVPPDAVRHDLNDYAKQGTPAARDAVVVELDLLLHNAHAMQSRRADFTAERARLNDILSRYEFRKVGGETWYDRLKREVQLWIWHLIGRFLSSSAYPAVSRIVIWGLLALALAVAGWWVVRLYREKNIYTQFSGEPPAIAARPWRDWEADAQAAAQEGRWRDAIHCLYWAGISFLETQGLWRPDPARTPREYLRLLPSADPHRPPLQQLTRSFEQVWYGNDTATPQRFAGASALLEQLGCR